MTSLLRESMPRLCGWAEMMDVAMKTAVEEGIQRGTGGDPGNISSGSDGGVPF